MLSNRQAIWEEMRTCEPGLKEYLIKEFEILQQDPGFPEWIGSHTGYGYDSDATYILEQISEFCSK